MIYEGRNISCKQIENNLIEIIFDNETDTVNKLGLQTLKELKEAVAQIQMLKGVQGLLITSKKSTFIVGADVTEFTSYMKMSEEEIKDFFLDTHKTYNIIEDLDFPTVCAINGAAMGGGFELCLATSFRVVGSSTKLGLPEVKLGLFPGWGGTVRLPRLIGADNAIEWIASGNQYSAEDALKYKAIEAVVPDDKLRESALELLSRAVSGKLDWKQKRTQKTGPLKLNKVEAGMVFEGAKGFVFAKAGPNYPAPLMAIEVMQASMKLNRQEAIEIEAANMAKATKTDVARCLTSIFLGDQYLKRVCKKMDKSSTPVKKAAVIGAGIMGGGIAYQSAFTGTPIVMKDINEKALELGMNEASGLLSKLQKRGKIDLNKTLKIISSITPTLNDEEIKSCNVIIEAVVENPKVKDQVLCALEKQTGPDMILASNTSTISIDTLAKNLERPENFCGMHFFNPVYKMPLVEVIRGKKSSDETIATVMNYALAMKKVPILVNDCPGFLVNRVLFPYLMAFTKLIEDGVSLKRIDKVMEKFGWPMGPAYLMDVIGIDTCFHALSIMCEGFPQRMQVSKENVIKLMVDNKRLGQKNKVGFYKYSLDKKGKLKKELDESVDSLINKIAANPQVEVTDEQIQERMMIPMLFEAALCLEEKIVESPVEVDMGLVYGLGFPPFRGGIFHHADSVGASKLIEAAKVYESLGNIYKPNKAFVEMAANNQKFYKD
ncbi:MAG: fatty acid oxidation complex subunit alpha FadB [Bacteriovoracaceae bacterium]|nr:fatty acid oxidation complex subunit alpha FadB [Bacteriovoracaceae bacterium]